MKFRKKPVEIDAFLASDVPPAWFMDAIDNGIADRNPNGSWDIKTLEGTHLANPDDWIVRGIKGELYPVKPDIFAATYELVSADDGFVDANFDEETEAA